MISALLDNLISIVSSSCITNRRAKERWKRERICSLFESIRAEYDEAAKLISNSRDMQDRIDYYENALGGALSIQSSVQTKIEEYKNNINQNNEAIYGKCQEMLACLKLCANKYGYKCEREKLDGIGYREDLGDFMNAVGAIIDKYTNTKD